MQRHGWVLLFHECIVEQLQKLHAAAARAQRNDPKGFERNANVKLFRALSQLILETVPSDPARDEYRQGNTLGPDYRHWRRAKVGRRFRLFFRYDSRRRPSCSPGSMMSRRCGRRAASPTPTPMFEKMLERGNPPDDWDSLVAASRSDWSAQEKR
jgi:toxin YhaV